MTSFAMTRCFPEKTPVTFLMEPATLPYIRSMYLIDLLTNLQHVNEIPGLARRAPSGFTFAVMVDEWYKQDRCMDSPTVANYAEYLAHALYVNGHSEPVIISHDGQYFLLFEEAAIVKAKASLDRFKEKNGKKLQGFISNVQKGNYYYVLLSLTPIRSTIPIVLLLAVGGLLLRGGWSLIKWMYAYLF